MQYKEDDMNHSLIDDFFFFILAFAGAWCVQYAFGSIFDTLINDFLPMALGRDYAYYYTASLSMRILQLIPFAIYFALICFLISLIAELAVMTASESMVKQKKLRRYNLNDMHQAFFAQMLTFALVVVIPGWLYMDSIMMKFIWLALGGGLAVVSFLFVSAMASECNDNGVILLWILIFVPVFMFVWMLSGRFMFTIVFTVLALLMIPLRKFVSRLFDRVFDHAAVRFFGTLIDDDDEFVDVDYDSDDF